MKKLKSRAGESVAETLVAVLMISLVFLFLAESIVTAARINNRVDQERNAFQQEKTDPVEYSVTIDGKPLKRGKALLYRTGNGYYYYEYQKN